MNLTHSSLMDDNESNALDFNYETVTQRHGKQSWKYEYPRHIRQNPSNVPGHCRKTIHYPYRGRTAISQDEIPYLVSTESENKTCSVSRRPSVISTLDEVTEIHWSNICRNLDKRLKIAKAKRDKFLISLLEKEYQDLNQMCVDFS